VKITHDATALVLALLLAARTPDAQARAVLSWYDPALGGINCDAECAYMGHDTPVAQWYGRAAACPPEIPRGAVIRITGSHNADGYWRCLDGGGAVVTRADGVVVLDLLSRYPIHREIVAVDIFYP
jgi:hypothetical protein